MSLGPAIDEYADMGMSQYSGTTFKEVLCRKNRLDLVHLCLDCISKQTENNGSPKGRGKPQSASTKLAHKLGVHPRTAARWASNGDQSNNINAEHLAELAFELDPEKTIKILRAAIETYGEIIDEWIADMNNGTGGGTHNNSLDSHLRQSMFESSHNAPIAHTEEGNDG